MRHTLVLLALLGCTASWTTKVLEPKLAPTCFEAVRLFLRPDSVHAPFREVAYLRVEGTNAGEGKLGRSLRRQAAVVGANGVIFHPYLDNKQDVIGTTGNAVAILIPSDTASTNQTCAVYGRADTSKAGSPGMP